MEDLRADACVVGGGPAGAAAAWQLAQLGLDVAVIDAGGGARGSRGVEALAASTIPLLDQIGVRERVDGPRAYRPRAAVVDWQREGVRVIEEPDVVHVDRADLDRALLDAAIEEGARVVAPARVGRARRVPEGWRIPLRHGGAGGPCTARARVLVDAAGRRGCMPGVRFPLAAPTVALSATWSRVPPKAPDMLLEAADACWIWAGRGVDRYDISVFLDPAALRAPGAVRLERAHESAVRAGLLGRWLAGASPGRVRARSATPSRAADVAGDGWVRAGDAALALDPLSSQGIRAALASGLRAAVAAAALAWFPERGAAARRFFEERLARDAESHARSCAALYSEASQARPTPFWEARSRASRTLNESTPRGGME